MAPPQGGMQPPMGQQPGAQPQPQQQAPKKMSTAEFAAKVRPLLKGVGGDVSDQDLVGKILKRRPDLASKVDYQEQQAAQPQPAQGGGAQGGMKPIGFGGGLAAGLNPFHTPPEGIKKKVGSVATAAEDMVNAREISQRGGSGDKAGAIGEAAGTALQYGAGGKLLEGAGAGLSKLGEVAEHSDMMGPAMKYAKQLSREIGGSIKNNQIAARYIQPLRTALDTRWDALHSALNGQTFPLDRSALQMIRKMGKAEIPGVAKLANELAGRTGMDYKEAEYYRRQMSKMVGSGKAEHWASDLEKFVDYLEGEVQGVAQKAGMGDVRTGLKTDTKAVANLGRSVAGTALQNATAGKKIGGAIAGGLAGLSTGPSGIGLGALLGERAAASPAVKLLPQLEVEGDKLAQKLGVKLGKNMFGKEVTKSAKAGKALQTAGKVGPAAAAMFRGAHSELFDHSQ